MALSNRGVDADLSKYFDTIPHRELLQFVSRRIMDRQVLRLIKLWLKAPVEEWDGDGFSGNEKDTKNGRGGFVGCGGGEGGWGMGREK